jgi:hypothetical protein
VYLANASSPKVRDAMRAGLLGQMVTPAEGRKPLPGVPYGADNGRYGKGYPGDAEWFTWLDSLPREHCLFAVAPDVVADAAATLAESLPWLPRIRALGFPAAFVAQDGLEHLDVPWDQFDVMFIGGTTAWKLSAHAARLAREAKDRGKRVHMGRVNSGRRKAIADLFECDTVDGTFLAFGPDVNLPRLLRWMDEPSLFGGDAA